jgi:hypothetical protein
MKGTVSKHKYFIPKYLVRGYDGHTLWFNVTEQQAETEFKREMPPTVEEYYKYRTNPSLTDTETWIPSLPETGH